MGFHTAYSFSQCSDETKYSCSLARAFTAFTHAKLGRTYGIFHQSMLRRAWAFVPSSQSLHCSRTYTKYTLNGRSYGIFFQPMLRRALACVQSCQNLNCSRTCTKWAYIWHIFSVNAQTRLIMHAVSEPPLLSHMHKMGVFMASFFSQCSNKP